MFDTGVAVRFVGGFGAIKSEDWASEKPIGATSVPDRRIRASKSAVVFIIEVEMIISFNHRAEFVSMNSQ